MPKLIDIDKICEDLPEVTNLKITKKNKFTRDGLFSEQIFGPIKNYTCQCNEYHGVSRKGTICEKCGVEIANSDERRKRFAKITLPIPVVNPIFYDLLVAAAGRKVKKMLDSLMTDQTSALFFREDSAGNKEAVIRKVEDIEDTDDYYEGLDAIQKLVDFLVENIDNESDKRWDIIKKNHDKLFIHNVLVLPADLRPASKSIEKDNRTTDTINSHYSQILDKKNTMSGTVYDLKLRNTQLKETFYSYFRYLQDQVNGLYDYILKKLAKKNGLIRGNILGKRVDFSGRSVIIPSVNIEIDECVLPYKMVLELFRIQLANKLIESHHAVDIVDAQLIIDQCIETGNPCLLKLCKKITVDEFCILNRQPTLHRLGLIAFKIKVELENVVKIHPLVCEGFNADFDGDTMAVYIPITKEGKEEVKERMLATKNLINPNNGRLSMTPNQDIIFGIYALSKNLVKSNDADKETEFKGVKMTRGMQVINKCFPEDYPPVTGIIDKKRLISILKDISSKYSTEEIAKTLNLIKFAGFLYSTYFGITMSLFGFFVTKAEKFKDEIYSDKDISKQLAKINSQEVKDFLRINFAYADIIDSGSRGSWDQVNQMIFSRGFISNFEGQILSTPIKNSLIHGLTPDEFFNSTYGCRKGLLDVALNTGKSGYLSRKLVFSCANLQLGDENDCGTEDLLEVFVKDEKKGEMLIGKYFKEKPDDKNEQLKLFSESDIPKYVNKIIFVRSPIFCRNPEICKTCYGDFYKVVDTKYIGVVAAQALGEANTQLVLRTFHTSGVAMIDNKKSSSKKKDKTDFVQKDIVANLSVVNEKLHSIPKNTDVSDLVSSIFDIYNLSRSIMHVHFECIVAQLMWYNDTKWRLLKDRHKHSPHYYSIQSVPSQESWLLGLAFSDPKKHIIKGLTRTGRYSGIMDKILLGDKM